MLIKSISFPTYLEDIKDVENDNIDVFVELENDNDYTYTVTVATAKNLESLINKKKLNYYGGCCSIGQTSSRSKSSD